MSEHESNRINPSWAAVAAVTTLLLATPAAGKPPAPTGVSGTALSATQVKLKWNAACTDCRYSIERAEAGGALAHAATTDPNQVQWIDPIELEPNTTYRYTVKTLQGGVASSTFGQAQVMTKTPPPTDFSAKPEAGQKVKLAWKGSPTNSFKIERAAEECKEGTTAWTSVLSPAVLKPKDGGFERTDTGLGKAAPYCYRLAAISPTGNPSVWIDKSVHTGPPQPPADLKATAKSKNEIELTWKPKTTAATYRIYRDTGGTQPNEVLATTEPGAAKHNDKNDLKENTKYHYWVVAALGDEAKPVTAAATTKGALLKDPEEVRFRYDEAEDTRVIRCSASKVWCEPRASLLVSAHHTSTIQLRDLPAGVKELLIDAGSVNQATDERKLAEATKSLYKVESKQKKRAAEESLSRAHVRNCNGKTALSIDLARRKVKSFKQTWIRRFAEEKIRGEARCDRARLLVTREGSSSVDIYYRLETDGPWTPLKPVELEYQTWWIDIGGFYAMAPLSDVELKSRPVTLGEGDEAKSVVEILGQTDGEDWEPRTGIIATFFPANYPNWGISFGLSDSEGRSQSYYLGGSFRLLGRKSAAVLTGTLGGLAAEVRRFPDLATAKLTLDDPKDARFLVEANHPLLPGMVSYEFEFFVALTVQFALDSNKAGK